MHPLLAPDHERAVLHHIERLAIEFRGKFSPETIAQCAQDSAERFKDARVQAYVPLFIYRFTRERLQTVAKLEGLMKTKIPEVLFVCVHNAGRSQMAAALTHQLSGGKVRVRSAGSAPASEINPAVVQVMAELGLDLSQEFPKLLTEEAVQAADVVITMGCGDACPLYLGKRYEDWDLDDPAGQSPEKVRAIRDQIRRRVEQLLAELNVPISRTG
jgi:protein-tyrosine-phosphatase